MLYAVDSRRFISLTALNLLILVACSVTPAKQSSDAGVDTEFRQNRISDTASIPDLIPNSGSVTPISSLSQPQVLGKIAPGKTDTVSIATTVPVKENLYSVVADNIPVKEILQTIALDSQTRVSFVGDIEGDISLSVINQPLEFILQQINRQAPVRYEVHGERLLVLEDKPLIRTYEIDYLNMRRLSESRVDLATQIGSMSTSIESNASALPGSNGSQLFVENRSENSFWESVTESISGILGEKIESGSTGSENVFVNKESGVVTVRARDAQHRSIKSLLDKVVLSAQRQVLIEATVVEVTLNDKFESGVDWQVLNSGSDSGANFDFTQLLAGLPQASEALTPATALLSYSNPGSILGNLSATLKLLQQFGDVQVLSSPKIIAMNNQPAVLKVVDNRVYFTFEVDRLARENGDERTVVDSTVHSVPVGLVMNVTPFISKDKEVILNVRPTISRILNFAEDPGPALAGQNQVRNLIPEIQVREMESLLRVQSGNVAIIGGLMQNKVDNRTAVVPGLGGLPILGKLFSHKTREIEKTELLIFLRPTVIDSSNHRANRTPDGNEKAVTDSHLIPDYRATQRLIKEGW